MIKGLTVADFPEVAAQWHPTKNNGVLPKEVAAGSHRKIWWRCFKGHEYESRCNDRLSIHKSGCPCCSNKKVCHENCLETCHPEIAKEFHPTKNGKLTPKDIIAGSHKKYWWKCSKGHEWQATCSNRTGNNKTGCPCCDNKKVCHENCLETCHPEIAKEFHPTKNGKLTPKDIIAGSNRKIWWKCSKGHEWQATCNDRTGNHKSDCPFCSNKKVCYDNCLETCCPEIAKEWHPTKNGKLTPKDIIAGSNRKIWWKCSKGHEWQATCSNRTGNNKTGCPCCDNKKVCHENCLETRNPDIAKEWHPIKNGSVMSKDVIAGSHKKYWWKCYKGHEWQATCSNRTGPQKQGCPYCANSKGENKISEFLDKIGHKYTCQSKYISCKNNRPLPFDFHVKYDKSENLIEYHGRQHYSPSHFGSKKQNAAIINFISIIKNDYIKENWCKSKRKNLLVIPYWDYDRIEEILTDFFAGKEPVFSEPPGIVKKNALKREKIIKKLLENGEIK